MPAPTNISAATAQLLPTWGEHIQDVSEAAGPSYTVWYKYVPPPNEIMVGIWAHAPLSSHYYPQLNVWIGELGSLEIAFFFGTVGDTPIQVPVTPFQPIYLEVKQGFSGHPVPDATLTVSLVQAPRGIAPAGSLLIPDDEPGFPAALVSPETGEILGFIPFPAGEGGEVLPSATMLVEDKGTNTVRLYDGALNELANLAIPIFNDSQISSDRNGTFYVGDRGLTTSVITAVSAAGVIGQSWTLPLHGFMGQAPSLDGSVLYYTGNPTPSGLTGPVKRYDLINDTTLSDLAPTVSGAIFNKDVLVLQDGSVLASYGPATGSSAHFINRYDGTTGVLLNTYTLPTGSTADHLAHGIDNDASVYVWMQTDDDTVSTWIRIRVSDGAVLSLSTTAIFETGFSSELDTDTPSARFGVSHSCPFMVTRTAITIPPSVSIPPDNTNICECVPLPKKPKWNGRTLPPPITNPPPRERTIGAQTLCSPGGGQVPVQDDFPPGEAWWSTN